ncbi:hypothetical protein GFY24_00110 [Nocardia sp. SYP-A9097]|uniref:hypothetical protein n=1 Tax=Nocardia sp. SYP-A9097 TaxID=2663237 RepID=UPI00129B6A93|nr:hypothetical protein [Nocardia sp. SYP-A9097]MRH85881.1 hypothetical protein [Nocardia sp. SYP-A9097]
MAGSISGSRFVPRWLRFPVNYLRILAILFGIVLVFITAYWILGRSGGNLLATNVFFAALGAFLGVIWPAVRRAIIRARSPVEVGEYLVFAGQKFPFKVIDGPTLYQPQDLVLNVTGNLELPATLQRAKNHMAERMRSYRGSQVLFDGDCYLAVGQPMVRRSWENIRERPTVVVDLKKTSYFVRVLCRGALARSIEEHIAMDWPTDIPSLHDLRRSIITLSDGFSPFLHPGAGINLCLVAYDRMGRPWTLVQKRGTGIAENTGVWATSIHESFSSDDFTADDTIDPFLTAARGAREELGISLTKIQYFVVGIDEGSLPGDQVSRSGGLELIGYAETSLPAERLEDTRFRGRDKFEAEELIATQLSVEAILKVLQSSPPERWFPPALLAVLETLERFRPGSWHRLAAALDSTH